MKYWVAKLLEGAWLLALACALLSSAAAAYSRTMQFEERAFGCDPFGYLCMAKEVRRAAAEGRFPDYAIDTPHTRELIEHLKAQPNLPGPSWYTLTGPHAHHYQHRAGRVGPQYPPGTGAMLALFPQGEALHGLSITVIIVFSVTGLLALGLAFVKRTWAAVGGGVLALQTGFEVISRHGDASYSIIAVVLPLLVVVVGLVAARRWAIDRPRLSRVAAFLAGASFGFAVLVRIPVLFLLPGVAILVVGAARYAFVDSRTIAFGLGAALFGTLPLIHHQHRVAGGWNVSTYGTDDAAPPSMKPVDENIRYYLYESPGSAQNVNLRVALLGFLGVALLPGRNRSWLDRLRLLAAAAAVWGLPMAYFLTHAIRIDYYPAPGIFAAVAILGVGGLSLRTPKAGADATDAGTFRLFHVPVLALALVPGAFALESGWKAWPGTLSVKANPTPTVEYPPELTDPRAWVFGDIQTGSVWYYSGQTAFKLPFADKQARAIIWQFVASRGEPVFLIRDHDGMQPAISDLEQSGGQLEHRGLVMGMPYYRVTWPR